MQDARYWAQFLAWEDRGLQPRQDLHGQAENLPLFSSAEEMPLHRASSRWYGERLVFGIGGTSIADSAASYSTQACRPGCHCHPNFSNAYCEQTMWRDMTRVGLAAVPARSGHVYVVARYSPAGTIQFRHPKPASNTIQRPDLSKPMPPLPTIREHPPSPKLHWFLRTIRACQQS